MTNYDLLNRITYHFRNLDKWLKIFTLYFFVPLQTDKIPIRFSRIILQDLLVTGSILF